MDLDEDEADLYIENDAEPEMNQLQEWAVEVQIPQAYLDKLLKILRARVLPNLPKSSKTFLGTSGSKYDISQKVDNNGSVGEFVYFGLAQGLQDCVNVNIHENNLLELEIACDGIPLVESGYQELWPSVCKIHFDPDVYQPFTVSAYLGESKPKYVELYLGKFIDEVNLLQRDGIIISGRHFEVKIKCFICDTPARAFLKRTIGHTGFNACERCTVQRFKEDGTTVFPNANASERTDASFRTREQATHHHGDTPLLGIFPLLNIISCFVLDFMHLCCLGVMKRMLENWFQKGRNKLSRLNRLELSRRMKEIKSQIPCEFQRKTGSVSSVGKWKATQFNFFLLYCGPVVLIGILNKTLYKHFLLFHAACRILYSERLCKRYTNKAKQYLRSFFIAMGVYYGLKSQVLNSHHLIHLADDVKNMGCSLIKYTAFPFESFLGKLKKYVRTANRPLAQLCRRLHELKLLSRRKEVKIPTLIEVLKEKQRQITEIKYKNCIITTKSPNNVILTKDDTILKIKSIIRDPDENILVKGEVLKKKKPIFTYPFNSKHLRMWQLRIEPTGNEETCDIQNVDCKLVKLSINLQEDAEKREYVIPLLHQ